MRQPTLSELVKRRFITCISKPGQTVPAVVQAIGIPATELCQIIAGQSTVRLSLHTHAQIARWLRMPLANVVALSGCKPRLRELMIVGMEMRGWRPNNSHHQIQAAAEAGLSVAVFRRALHGYADFRPSLRTCDRVARWLVGTGFTAEDIAAAADMTVRYLPDGRRTTVALDIVESVESYPCACGRAGCLVPGHIPSGPRRKWRSDACRMWAKRQAERAGSSAAVRAPSSLAHRDPIVRFIVINERLVPVQF